MAYSKNQYARSDQIRAHLFLDGVGTADPDPLYQSCLGIDAMTHDIGDITPVEVPDPDRYGEFVIVDGIPGQRSRWTTTMTTRKPIGIESALRGLERKNCPIDVHLTRGICDVPSDYNQFAELEIWEDVLVTSYSTTQISALSSDQRESTTESVDVSIGKVYSIFNMVYGLAAAPSEATGTVVGIVTPASWCCGTSECGVTFVASEDNVYFVTKSGAVAQSYAGGDIAGIAAVGNRLAVARDSVGIDFWTYTKNGLTGTATTRTVAAITGAIDCVGGNGRFGLLSHAMSIYRFDATGTNITGTDVTALCGVAATKVTAVGASVDDNTAVAVSDKGYTMYSLDGVEWKAGAVVVGSGSPVGSAIAAMNLETWIVGTTTGEIYLTADSGATFTKVLDVTGAVNDIKYASKHVAYAAIGSSLYRSTDGGASWTLEPNVPGRSFVTCTSVNFIAPCPDNVNSISMAALVGGVAGVGALRMITGRPG